VTVYFLPGVINEDSFESGSTMLTACLEAGPLSVVSTFPDSVICDPFLLRFAWKHSNLISNNFFAIAFILKVYVTAVTIPLFTVMLTTGVTVPVNPATPLI